ncbi:lysophospholipid acyltransferase family protein [Hydrogenimonas thermophila]|uniref:lysophospholipid acyltransferase family protein n=1 Tax=Hydrogenimonas thermophila TaxID=223786 RepID=UPI00293700B9|nr:lysophospholipid acyltransferase family protein [Hydrogenimonas thermophila]WOE69612.1 lysophospholipid acyltransferase family protein [Hydrogenimonas thermophila]WOE72126.1 lysophospholipid acyltransferase family protein [Hydrogenimonas thermophila]
MEIKQRGSKLGTKIILILYKTVGYKFPAFIVNFIALYYALTTTSIRKNLQSYYDHLEMSLNFNQYFKHIRFFSFSIFDRFVSRIDPNSLKIDKVNDKDFYTLSDGGIVLLSHFGGWAIAANALQDDKLPTVNVVMRENTKEELKEVENSEIRRNKDHVHIIDLNEGGLAANIKIANALMAGEIVAFMADRVVDPTKTVTVKFFNEKVNFNRSPFDIALKTKKPLMAVFIVNIGLKHYKLMVISLHSENNTTESLAQIYANTLEKIIKEYPGQWYNFYDFFKQQGVNYDDNR